MLSSLRRDKRSTPDLLAKACFEAERDEKQDRRPDDRGVQPLTMAREHINTLLHDSLRAPEYSLPMLIYDTAACPSLKRLAQAVTAPSVTKT
jgi:hypothetical protein